MRARSKSHESHTEEEKMRYFRTLILVILFLQPPKLLADDLAEIKQLIEQTYQTIWSDFDFSAIDQFHTADYTLLNNGEEAWSNFDVVIYLKRIKKLQSKRNFCIRNWFWNLFTSRCKYSANIRWFIELFGFKKYYRNKKKKI